MRRLIKAFRKKTSEHFSVHRIYRSFVVQLCTDCGNPSSSVGERFLRSKRTHASGPAQSAYVYLLMCITAACTPYIQFYSCSSWSGRVALFSIIKWMYVVCESWARKVDTRVARDVTVRRVQSSIIFVLTPVPIVRELRKLFL